MKTKFNKKLILKLLTLYLFLKSLKGLNNKQNNLDYIKFGQDKISFSVKEKL